MIRSIKLRILLLAVCFSTLQLGCSKRRDVVVYEQVDRGHICSHSCLDHHYVDDRVVYVSGHRHSNNCGHYWDGGRWRMNRAARLNPRQYRREPIHLKDRHGHYNRPKPKYRDRDDHQNRRRDGDDRRINNSRRDRDDRQRNIRDNRKDRRDRRDERKVLRSRQQTHTKSEDTMGQKRSSDRD